MVVQNFSDTWTAITESAKEFVKQLDYREDIVSDGNIDAVAPAPPYIKIMALPDSSQTTHSRNFETMRFVFLIAGNPALNIKTAICNTLHFAKQVKQYFTDNSILMVDNLTGSKIEPEALYTNHCMMSLELLSPYME